MNVADPVVAGTIVTAVATVALAIITAMYTRLTSKIAQATLDASRSASDAAEMALLQSVLAVQPRIVPISEFTVDSVPTTILMPGGSDPQPVPIRIVTEFQNVGVGPAYNSAIEAEILGIFFSEGTLDNSTTSAPQGATIKFERHVPSHAKKDLAQAVSAIGGGTGKIGSLTITCEDVLGYLIETSWEIAPGDDGVLQLRNRKFSYRSQRPPNDHPRVPLLDWWRDRPAITRTPP